ncbi:MAG: SMC-Scp complex subunit ScpB [SAR324 cluster bacterium]|nr:SMC-Scp complex subunit ScpB [SAR324 cluster bacterium]MCZ6557354.1 SMC-Scp complex subunit ScpB [SAR324 cluster bacterium]MCZ6628376.1 SMC-Scp complex subunit ScpB [SAR324 cluster bacterium]MCZ6645756.1 SMC-Scp complex subunit ScpB [SAR324 cluster bacterium]MCZ6730317.1 SMC-Scp complex subunit ScpB [SAR324 cluster bacterium]
MDDKDAKKVMEAVLFASNEVYTAKQLAIVLGNSGIPRVRSLIGELNQEYEQTNRTFRIVKIGDGYQMRTLPIFKTWIQKAEPLKPIRLTQATMETLAVVAYRQPVTRAEVEHLRGVDSSSGLRTLLEHRLIRIVGKDNGPGRALIYGTTRDFLGLFNMQDLRDLPTLEDFDLTVQEPAVAAEAEAG